MPAFGIHAVPRGYDITLNRKTAAFLSRVLDATGDEKQLAARIREEATKRADDPAAGPDDATVAKLQFLAVVVQTQLPAFKKAMRQNAGPGGVVIRVTGLQAPQVRFPNNPRLERAAGVARAVMPLLPDDARDAMEAIRAIARTTPLTWTVEPLP